jgi:hypothetical protein
MDRTIHTFHWESSTTQHQHDKARLLASARKESGAWLSALPCSYLGLALDDDSLQIAVGLRLGTHLCHPHPHTCICEKPPVDDRGTHDQAV